ncbi:MAG: methionine--tRNA ligase subunit beta, partial [Oscillospiraceae bacterium]|nr:methionine--tRNA ligase subunit beta [Oscillospiraceae bacterium]
EKIIAQCGAKASDVASLSEFTQSGSITVGEAEVLFARIDEAKKLAELNAEMEAAMAAAAAANEPEEEKTPEITIDDFDKVELRVVKILECEPVKKSDKLLRIIVDDGEGQRQIVSGIAQQYTPDELIGKKVILVANLKPAKLRGVESYGMLLAADMPDGGCKVIFADDEIAPGAQIH